MYILELIAAAIIYLICGILNLTIGLVVFTIALYQSQDLTTALWWWAGYHAYAALHYYCVMNE